MNLKTLNPLPILVTAAMVFGIVAHDTNIDRAAALAVALPSIAAVGYGAIENIAHLGEQQVHTHVEQVSVSNNYTSAMPRLMPREDENTNGRKRKQYASDADSEYHWPSI